MNRPFDGGVVSGDFANYRLNSVVVNRVFESGGLSFEVTLCIAE